MTPLLTVRNLVSGYDGVAVVHGIDLDVRAGEMVVLLGPNGAGKSTTLLTLAGELPVLRGTVELFGAPASGRLERRVRQGLGFIPEGRSVFPQMSVLDNLRLGRGDLTRAITWSGHVGTLLRRRSGLLSGGEQQILSVARVLAAEPRLILADELSLGLAPKVVDGLLSQLRTAADHGAGVLIVEQHAHQALAVADRGYVLRRGEVVLQGDADRLAASIDELTATYLSDDGPEKGVCRFSGDDPRHV